jgi:F-type H+-transporting ATPase subunit c
MLAEFKMIGAGFATVALAGVGNGIGIIFGNLLNSVSRNPSMNKILFNYAILGFALTEAVALFTIMIVFIILF